MSLATSISETCESNPILSAIADGIAHTDIGLTIATIVLAVVTWNLIDDRKQARIRHHWARLVMFRHTHAERDTFNDEGNLIEHGEIDRTEIGQIDDNDA